MGKQITTVQVMGKTNPNERQQQMGWFTGVTQGLHAKINVDIDVEKEAQAREAKRVQKMQKEAVKQAAAKKATTAWQVEGDEYEIVGPTGGIDHDNFRKAVFKGANLHPNVLRKLFQHYDRDGSGDLSVAEFKVVLRSIGVPSGSALVERFVRSLDDNKDATIDVEEWLDFFKHMGDFREFAQDRIREEQRKAGVRMITYAYLLVLVFICFLLVMGVATTEVVTQEDQDSLDKKWVVLGVLLPMLVFSYSLFVLLPFAKMMTKRSRKSLFDDNEFAAETDPELPGPFRTALVRPPTPSESSFWTNPFTDSDAEEEERIRQLEEKPKEELTKSERMKMSWQKKKKKTKRIPVSKRIEEAQKARPKSPKFVIQKVGMPSQVNPENVIAPWVDNKKKWEALEDVEEEEPTYRMQIYNARKDEEQKEIERNRTPTPPPVLGLGGFFEAAGRLDDPPDIISVGNPQDDSQSVASGRSRRSRMSRGSHASVRGGRSPKGHGGLQLALPGMVEEPDALDEPVFIQQTAPRGIVGTPSRSFSPMNARQHTQSRQNPNWWAYTPNPGVVTHFIR